MRSLSAATATRHRTITSIERPDGSLSALGVGVVLFCAFVATGLFRYAVLRSGGAPATVDAGNWLAFGESLFGSSVRSDSIVYPPVVPILTWASVAVFGLTDGVAVLGALASLAPAGGLLVVLRRRLDHPAALVAVLLALASSSIGEATAWGGFPQLIGFGVLPVWLATIEPLVRQPDRRNAFIAGLAIAAIAATSHFVLLLAVTAAVILGILVLSDQPRPALRDAVRASGWFILPAIAFAPLYVSLASGIFGNGNDAAGLVELTFADLDVSVEFLYREAPVAWRLLVLGVVVGPIALVRRRADLLWRIPVALTVALAIVLLATRQGRYLYVLPLLAAWWLALVVDEAIRRAPDRTGGPLSPAVVAGGALIGLVALSSFLLVRSADFFHGQRDFYGIMTPSLVDVLEEIDETSPADTIVAVPAIANAPLGWWAEAITDRSVIYGAPLRVLNFDDELERARIGNKIFQPGFPMDDGLAAAEAAGVDVMVVPASWPFYDVDDIEAAFEPDELTYTDDGVVIRPDW